MDDIDLYFQPLENPYVALTFFILKFISISVGEIIGIKILIMLTRESRPLTQITKLFVISQMILWPITIFLISITNFIYPLQEIVSPWFCSIAVLMNTFFLLVTSSHSFLSSLMRYILIVQSEKVSVWGKEKVKKLFIFLSIFLPLLITLWKQIDGSELHPISYVNK